MKIKLDFVSNSSSTSFVYISSGELSEATFLEAAGVGAESPVSELFRQMYSEVQREVGSRGKVLTSIEDVEKYSGRHEFTPAVLEQMKLATGRGDNVIVGELSSDGSLAESVLCMEVFQIESDRFFINAYNNYW